jgi:S1-C subfamily serine protease
MRHGFLTFVLATLLASCSTTGVPVTEAPEAPEATPPKKGEQFYEFAELPSGPKAVPGAITGEMPEDAAAPKATTPPEAVSNAITRRELLGFLERGPRHALTLVEVQPAFQGQTFVGYQVMGLSDDGERAFGTALHRGDVILKVNRHSIARPEDYMSVWQGLKKTDRVSVTVLRAGQEVAMSWPVID